MRIWTFIIFMIWLVLAYVATLPSQLLSDRYEFFARSGTAFELKTPATATFDSERFFAVEQSGVVYGAKKEDSQYKLDLQGTAGDYWRVVRGNANVNLKNEVGNTFFEIRLYRSFLDWIGRACLLFIVGWVIWLLGSVVILQW